jgi:hypothetical protein
MDDLSHGFVFMFSSYLTFLQNIRIELVTECILIYSLVSNKFLVFLCVSFLTGHYISCTM